MAPWPTSVPTTCTHARLRGRVAPITGIAPFGELVAQVMSTARMRAAWSTAQLVHLPIHASWLNQIEIVFSIIQRKVIRAADFADLDALAARLTAFEPRYNATATAFDWRFNHAELADLLACIDAHQRADALVPAA